MDASLIGLAVVRDVLLILWLGVRGILALAALAAEFVEHVSIDRQRNGEDEK